MESSRRLTLCARSTWWTPLIRATSFESATISMLRRLHHPRAIRSRLEHEPVAFDLDQNLARSLMKPTGLWMFRNTVILACPDETFSLTLKKKVPWALLKWNFPIRLEMWRASETHSGSSIRHISMEQGAQEDRSTITRSKGQWPWVRWNCPTSSTGPRTMLMCNASTATMVARCARSRESSRSFKHNIDRKEDFNEGYSDVTTQDTDEHSFEPYEYTSGSAHTKRQAKTVSKLETLPHWIYWKLHTFVDFHLCWTKIFISLWKQ